MKEVSHKGLKGRGYRNTVSLSREQGTDNLNKNRVDLTLKKIPVTQNYEESLWNIIDYDPDLKILSMSL